MGYVVAADGGNSKTDLVLASTAGDVLARVSGAGTRPLINGLTATAAGLAGLSRSAIAAAHLPSTTTIDVASFYLANADFPEEEVAMHGALTGLHVADRIEVRNDTLAVLKAGSRRGWGIAVVVGAGINAAGVHPDGREERFLGIGEMSGDWGGGRSVAVAGLGAAVRDGDGRGPATSLRGLVAEAFGTDPEATAIAATGGEITDTQLFAFAPVVFQAAANGDAVATAIVTRLADEVVGFVAALLRRMNLTESDADVVLGGGVLQAGHRLLLNRVDDLVHAVAPAAQVRVLDVPPVLGALASALTLAEADAEAIDRARAALR